MFNKLKSEILFNKIFIIYWLLLYMGKIQKYFRILMFVKGIMVIILSCHSFHHLATIYIYIFFFTATIKKSQRAIGAEA